MKVTKKLLLVVAIACACGIAQAANIQWNPATTYTIPNDGNTYYVDFSKTLTADLTNNGTLELRTGATIQPDFFESFLNNGTMNVSGGTIIGFVNGYTSSGTINLYSGVLISSGATSSSNAGSGITATINIYGGELQVSGTFYNGGAASSEGIINLMGGSINVIGSGSLRQGTNLSPGSIGRLNISSGTFHMSGSSSDFTNGGNSYGYVTMTGGLFKISDGQFYNGNGISAYGYFTATGGTLELAGGTFTNGYDAPSTGNLTVSTPAKFIMGGGTLTDGPGAGSISIYGNAITIASGTLTNAGTFTIPSQGSFVINNNGTFLNNSGGTLNVSENGKLNILGRLQNNSASSVNIYGTTYSYSYIENGDGSNPGALNIHYPGNLYLLGAELRNGNAGSAINIESGGSLRSYHGDVDTTLGSLNIKAGGSYDHVRGNNPGAPTVSAGGNFVEDEIIYVKENLEIDYTWTITNQSTIDGDGNTITFGTDGGILIQGPDASLLIKDAVVKDVSGNQIRCTDDTTTLSFDNVTWIQDTSYTFSKGALVVKGDWTIQGRDTSFTFSSDQTLTIQQNASLIFDEKTSFSYDSPAATNLVLADADAYIRFNDATLAVKDDLRLTKGVLHLHDGVTFNIPSGKTLYFGDNSSATNNLTLNFTQDVEWAITGAGAISNQNV